VLAGWLAGWATDWLAGLLAASMDRTSLSGVCRAWLLAGSGWPSLARLPCHRPPPTVHC
jgi:hypothetical protein